jgi:hypothetical protein
MPADGPSQMRAGVACLVLAAAAAAAASATPTAESAPQPWAPQPQAAHEDGAQAQPRDPAVGALKCLSESGAGVDWWFIYKSNNGLDYVYVDASSKLPNGDLRLTGACGVRAQPRVRVAARHVRVYGGVRFPRMYVLLWPRTTCSYASRRVARALRRHL